MKELRHVSISSDPDASARQLGENARDANEDVDLRVSGVFVPIFRYAARGDVSAKISLASPSFRPRAVVLLRACLTNDPGGSVLITHNLNFYHDSIGVGAYEPSGLIANEMYNLLYLLVE